MKGREKGRKRMLKREVMLGEVLEVLMGGLRGLASVSSPSIFFLFVQTGGVQRSAGDNKAQWL